MLLRLFTVIFLVSGCFFYLAVANELTEKVNTSTKLTEQQTSYIVSLPSHPKGELTLSPQSGNLSTQIQPVRELTETSTRHIDTKQLLFDAVSKALNDSSDRGMLLADLLNHNSHKITLADLTDTFYQFAAQNNPQAKQSYHQFLQQRFDELRAKQLADIAQLDKQAIQKEVLHPVQSIQPLLITQVDSTKNSLLTENMLDASLFGITLLCLVGSVIIFKTRKRYLKASVESDQKTSPLLRQNEQLKTLIQQLRYRFEKLLEEYNKLKIQQEQKDIALACALFGYSPEQIPNHTAIKRRYRQLSKIYHPDSGGSDQEMKRLNQSMKLISNIHRS
ncbi:J domain-containing protein [Vibrio sagamiensis]|uniref:J domain-containing protein n=1 Tax=Vibrio sagamiensis NBRC 104589 TaxID=1219064 RepID=A0A511QEB9_9VIBR|nr:J domain-containing protein [Vibrio sagamiensis]PNQ54468.1 J domain-containing protein [Vibrio agarivorans]GEM75536.1 hypothetical protein VSA01S_16480 [Vibrio sagamiensis NBRC 104589]